jgi:nickel/cobalt exporter
LTQVPRLRLTQYVLLVACILLFVAAIDCAFAQPFGVTRGPAPPEVGGFTGWILAKQAEFYRTLSGLIRAAKADGSAAYTLLGISFLYGIFHAAGPGHGKAVISSYLVANDETWRRGIVLSFASAILQAFTAVAVVGIAAALLGATAKAMGNTVRVIEIVSYALIMLIGLRLLWVKGRAFLRLLRGEQQAKEAHGHEHHHHAHDHDHGHDHHHAHGHDHGHGHGHDNHHHAHHAHGHDHHHGHAHSHDHDHEDDASAWGHAHAPEPQELTGKHWLRRGLAAIIAVGLRPCSGAIIVLVFALAQGLFWIGVASTFVMGLGTAITVAAIATLAVGARGLADRFAKARPGAGMLLLRGLEAAAALVIVFFGAALLTGYIVSERLLGV